jgi:hypothetical protein
MRTADPGPIYAGNAHQYPWRTRTRTISGAEAHHRVRKRAVRCTEDRRAPKSFDQRRRHDPRTRAVRRSPMRTERAPRWAQPPRLPARFQPGRSRSPPIVIRRLTLPAVERGFGLDWHQIVPFTNHNGRCQGRAVQLQTQPQSAETLEPPRHLASTDTNVIRSAPAARHQVSASSATPITTRMLPANLRGPTFSWRKTAAMAVAMTTLDSRAAATEAGGAMVRAASAAP